MSEGHAAGTDGPVGSAGARTEAGSGEDPGAGTAPAGGRTGGPGTAAPGRGALDASVGTRDTLLQPAPAIRALPTIAVAVHLDHDLMLLILLEALLALVLLVLIVWWTMFSGRPKGEPPRDAPDASAGKSAPPGTKPP